MLESSALGEQSVTLAWQPSVDPEVAGYHVYYGTISGDYDGKISVLNQTRATIPNLIEGKTYYFAVTAFTTVGMESVPSNEVIYQVPGARLIVNKISMLGFPQAVNITSTGVVQFPWVLEASEDFVKWRTLLTGSYSAVNATAVAAEAPKLYFRLRKQ